MRLMGWSAMRVSTSRSQASGSRRLWVRYLHHGFDVSFSRALRGLMNRGLLIRRDWGAKEIR